MSALVSGIAGAVISLALARLAQRTHKTAGAAPDGWRRLRAGWFLNGTLVGSLAVGGLTLAFLLMGGSTRPDAETQNRFAIVLLIAFSAMTLYLAWIAHGRMIIWRDDELRVYTPIRGEVVRRVSDITAVRKSEGLGEYRLTFRDGSALRLSAYLHGADELVARAPSGAVRDQP